MFEDGIEQNNTLRHNLVVYTKPVEVSFTCGAVVNFLLNAAALLFGTVNEVGSLAIGMHMLQIDRPTAPETRAHWVLVILLVSPMP